MRRVRRLAAGCSLVAVSACGSTVATLHPTSTGAGQDGLGMPGAATAGGSTPGTYGAGFTTGAAQQGSGVAAISGASGTAGAGAGKTVAGSASGLSATYPGVTATSIYVAVTAAGNTGSSAGQQVGEAFGVTGFSSSPERPLINAMINDINRHGGVLGRKLVPVFHDYDPSDTRPYAQQSQESCSAYTEDHKVFAHLAVVSDATFFSCMEQHGTVGVERHTVGSDVLTRSFPGVFPVSDLDYTTACALLVRGLVAQGFLTRSSKIGVIQTDTPDFDRVRTDGVEPELARAGLRITSTYKINPVNQASDAAIVSRDASAAVLQFASKGIDRVLFVTPNGALFDIVFMQQAEQQGYRPKYGLSSHDAPVALGGGNAPAAQLDGSRGVGFSPYDDFDTIPGREQSPAVADCLATFKREGVAAPSDRGQVNEYLTFCATFRLFTDIAAAAGRDLTRATFIAAANALGRHWDDPFAIGGASYRAPGMPGGITAYQPIAYVHSCDCFRGAGPVSRLR